MGKALRDVRRETNRLPKKQSGLISGFPRKSKKGGIFKKVGLAGEVNSSEEDHNKQEMVCEIEASTKKSKLPKRNFKDTNGVVHASVPRKLRSAMKKRRLGSVSRPSVASKKLNAFKTGVESPKDFSSKKVKHEMECKVVTEPITKDEEEVAETLYALAGMFPGSDSAPADKSSRSDDALSDDQETKPGIIKVAEVDSSLVPMTEPTMGESHEATVSVMSSSARTKQIGEMPIRQAENFNGSTGTLDFLGRLKQSSVDVTEAPEKRIDIALAMKAVGTKLATSDTDYKSSGLALWPGLSSTVNPGVNVLPKPSAVKVPPWIGGATSPSKIASSFRSGPSRVQPKKLKRCASHIYISRLIKVLQARMNPRTPQQNEARPSEASGGYLRSITDCSEKVTPAGDALNSQRYPSLHLLDKHRTYNTKLVQDMTQNAVALYGPLSSKDQSYDFLSLSSAGDSKINTHNARNESASTSAVQSHFPPLNSIPQHRAVRTFSMPQQETCHISSAYNNRFPSASIGHQGRTQLPPYLPGPFAAAYHNHHHQQQQQQQQQQFWAAQYRAAAGNSLPLNQYAAFQSGHSLNPSSQSTMASLHAASTSYNDVSQQQQRLMAAAATVSMNHHHSRAMSSRQEHHFPLVYEDARTPLQLLCNDHS